MATSATIKVCPDCRSPLPEEIPQFCPQCGSDTAYMKAKRREEKLGDFTAVNTISGQYKIKLEEACKESKRIDARDNEDRIPSNPIVELQGKTLLAYKNLSPADKLNIMMDANEIMKLILHSGLSGEEMKPIIELAKSAGSIAEAADKFILARKSAIRL